MKKLYLNADDDGVQLLDKNTDYFGDIVEMFRNITELDAYTSTDQFLQLAIND